MFDATRQQDTSGDVNNRTWISATLAHEIARNHDTPTHALSLARLRANYATFVEAFTNTGLDMQVLYSVKTNYMPVILECLKELGCGADVVSGPELDLALKLGFSEKRLAFNGPYKTDKELDTAVRNNILINIDSISEGHRLTELALHLDREVSVGLRVNPGVAVFLGDDPTFNIQSAQRARESKFGFSIDDGAADAALAAMGLDQGPLRLTALHCHLGSQITDEAAFIEALDRVFSYVSTLRKQYPVTAINIGGGFGVSGIRRERRGPLRQLLALYGCDVLTNQSDGMDIARVANGIAERAREHNVSDMRFFCEPGRALVSDAMTMISRVIGIKRSGGLTWLVLDAGLNLLPTIAMAEKHRIIPLDQPIDGPTRTYRVAGPLCYEGDILADEYELPTDMSVGDLVSIEDSGAYTVSRSTNFIRPRAAVVAIDSGQPELCWRREEFDDIFTFHVPLSNHSS